MNLSKKTNLYSARLCKISSDQSSHPLYIALQLECTADNALDFALAASRGQPCTAEMDGVGRGSIVEHNDWTEDLHRSRD